MGLPAGSAPPLDQTPPNTVLGGRDWHPNPRRWALPSDLGSQSSTCALQESVLEPLAASPGRAPVSRKTAGEERRDREVSVPCTPCSDGHPLFPAPRPRGLRPQPRFRRRGHPGSPGQHTAAKPPPGANDQRVCGPRCTRASLLFLQVLSRHKTGVRGTSVPLATLPGFLAAQS